MTKLRLPAFEPGLLVRRQAEVERLRAPPYPPGRPFLVVTPLGLSDRALPLQWVTHGVVPVARRGLADWAGCSTPLYVRQPSPERVMVALAFEAAWRASFPEQRAELWELTPAAYAGLVLAKPALRAALTPVRLELSVEGLILPTAGQQVRLQAFHLPDPDDLDAEWAVLERLTPNPSP